MKIVDYILEHYDPECGAIRFDPTSSTAEAYQEGQALAECLTLYTIATLLGLDVPAPRGYDGRD